MCKLKRTEAIKKIEDIVIPINDKMGEVGSWGYRFLDNKLTYDECQVIEAYDKNGLSIPIEKHIHANSREIFYQIKGETTFDDESKILSGQIKILEPGEVHSPKISPGGAVVIIIHPVDESLRFAH